MLHHTALYSLICLIIICSSYPGRVLVLAARSCPKFGDEYSSSTTPHPSALVVRKSSSNKAEYRSISDAVTALNGLKGPQQIFIYPGTYEEQVQIKYSHPLRIQGFTSDASSLSQNKVTVHVAVSAASKGGNAESSAIWARASCIEMRNINVINSFGTGTDTQAVALTATGDEHVYMMCTFSSYQDTLYIKANKAFFYGCQVEGAVDFIFGPGTAWFENINIGVKPPQSVSTITAQRSPPDLQTRFVFNKAKVYGLPGTPTNSTFLGRPWSSNAAVMFQSCELSDIIKPEGWSAWNPPSDPRTQSIHFEEFSNTGPGSRRTRNLGRISKDSLSIEKVLGAGFAEWTR